MQVKNIAPTYNAQLDKLDFSLASGNNSTLFDQESIPEGRDHPDSWKAIKLITYQCFSPGGLAGVICWNGKSTVKSGEGAPCIESSALHTIIRSENIVQTIFNNLIPLKYLEEMNLEKGYPFWECMPESAQDKKAIANTKSFLGGLCPLSRIILLDKDRLEFTLGHCLSYPRFPVSRNPMTTVVARGKNEQGYLNINLEKAPWRELGGILETSGTNNLSGALALRHFISQDNNDLDIWVGGLVADKAKLIDIAEWVFNVPTEMLSNLDTYSNGVNKANKVEFSLKFGVDTFQTETKTKGSDAYLSIRRNAVQTYWSALERRSVELIDICNNSQTDLPPITIPVTIRLCSAFCKRGVARGASQA